MKLFYFLFACQFLSISLLAQKWTIAQRGEIAIVLAQGYFSDKCSRIETYPSGKRDLNLRLNVPDFFFQDDYLKLISMFHVNSLLKALIFSDSMKNCGINYTLMSASDSNKKEYRISLINFYSSPDSCRMPVLSFVDCLPFYGQYSHSSVNYKGAGTHYERELILKEIEYSPKSVSKKYFDLVAACLDFVVMDSEEFKDKEPLHIVYEAKTKPPVDYYYPYTAKRKIFGELSK